jgi:hypothetical protein
MPDDDEKEVLMRLNRYESIVLCHIDKSYERYLDAKGRITVKLKRALYGCIESARLWYEKLSADLLGLGYTKNEVDMCVFNRIEKDGSQSTIVVHVDDCLITAKNENTVSGIIEEIEAIYPSLSVKKGQVIDYIGMTFDFRERGAVKVTMAGYVEEFLAEVADIEGVSITPAARTLFNTHDGEPDLGEKDKERFHHLTAKLLYLAKRTRPDLLTPVSFLTKRVNKPNSFDMDKLKRAIKYLRGTREMGIKLEADKNLAVLAYVDASYGVHDDMKSHTGCVVGIGKGPLYAKSSTQKLNSKSSTEAELIGLSDSSNQIIWTRNFLISQGYDIGPAIVYQDNQSTIAMVKNGKSNSERTRHIAIRFYFVADRVASKEIKLEYMSTSDMLADVLTKPLQSHLFIRLRDQLLNWTSDDVSGHPVTTSQGSVVPNDQST